MVFFNIKKIFFDVDHLKSLLNLLQYCSCFIYLFWLQDMLARWPRIEPAPSALEGKVLNTGPPGKSLRI